MSLDFYLTRVQPVDVLNENITHNLGRMAKEAGIYELLWRPEEIGVTKASQVIEPLTSGIALLESDPERFKQFNSPNGWGMYEHFVPFCKRILQGCIEYPDADVRVWR